MTDITFENKYDALHHLALARARRVVRDEEDAQDIAQEAVLRAYASWSAVATYAEAWITRVATNLSISHLRRQGRDQKVLARWATCEPGTTRVDVAAALEQLPPRQRQVVVLRHVADLPEDEVAAILDISVGSVKRHLHRATASLKSSPSFGTAYDKAFDLRQQTMRLLPELAELLVPAPVPPDGWPPPPWDEVFLVRDGCERRRAADADGDVIFDADGNEVVARSEFGYTLYKPVLGELHFRSVVSVLPFDSMDATARHAVQRAVEVAERLGRASACEGALGVALAECLGEQDHLDRELLIKGLALENDGPYAAERLVLFAEREAQGWQRPPREDMLPTTARILERIIKDAVVGAVGRGELASCQDLLEQLIHQRRMHKPDPAVMELMDLGRSSRYPRPVAEIMEAINSGRPPEVLVCADDLIEDTGQREDVVVR